MGKNVFPILINLLISVIVEAHPQYGTTATSRPNFQLKCPMLPDRTSDNVELKCSYLENISNCSMAQLPPNTVVEYSCLKYFRVKSTAGGNSNVNHNQNPKTRRRIICKKNGQWDNPNKSHGPSDGFSEFMKFSCIQECGKYSNLAKGAPWQVTILKNKRTEACEGTLIPSLKGNPLILTSKDCVSNSNGTLIQPKDMRVSIGQSSLYVDSVLAPKDEKFNIAIVNVTMAIQISESVLPICLPFDIFDQKQGFQPQTNWTAGSIGIVQFEWATFDQWGLIYAHKYSIGFYIGCKYAYNFGYEFAAIITKNAIVTVTMVSKFNKLVSSFAKLHTVLDSASRTELKMEVISQDTCQALGYVAQDNEFCAIRPDEGESPMSTCTNVSGPFVLNRNVSRGLPPVFEVHGMPGGTLRINSCHQGAIYTKVQSSRKWITETIREISGIKEASGRDKCVTVKCRENERCIVDIDGSTRCTCNDGFVWIRDEFSSYCKKEFIGNSMDRFQNVQNTTKRPTHQNTNATIGPIEKPMRFSGCPPLEDNPLSGYEIDCTRSVDCTKGNVPSGTTAFYYCKAQFESKTQSEGNISATRKCETNGTWTQLKSNFKCIPKCGELNSKQLQSSIVENIKWPWVAALYEKDVTSNRKSFKFSCGGTLVAQNAILTAAGCVNLKAGSDWKLKNMTNFRVVLGNFYNNYYNNPSRRPAQISSQEFTVKAIHVHQEYNLFSSTNDIALIILNEPARITDEVHPICLPSADTRFSLNASPDVGENGTLVGWRIFGGESATRITETNLPIVSEDSCKANDDYLADVVNPFTNFCAGHLKVRSRMACPGEKGSGLYFKSRNNLTKYVISGIASWIPEAHNSQCNLNSYSLFTRVVAFRQWIDEIIASSTV